MKVKSRKGSVPVFLCSILMVSMLVLSVLVESASVAVGKNYAAGVLDLGSRSVLSEYDCHLKEDFGLFGLWMDKQTAEKKLGMYIRKTMEVPRGNTDLLSMQLESVNIDFGQYALSNPDIAEAQILESMKYEIGEKAILDAADLIGRPGTLEACTERPSSPQGSRKKELRILKNHRLIESLPSEILGDNPSPLGAPKGFDAKNLAEKAKNDVILNLYILRFFRNKMESGWAEGTFFFNEVEYVLCGQKSDETNEAITTAALMAARSAMDLSHIYGDAKKREAVLAAGALIAPGAGAVPMSVLVALAWAGAEAANDVSRLFKSERVPLLKTEQDWMMDLDSILEKKEGGQTGLRGGKRNVEKEPICSKFKEGLTYEDYLFLLLFCVERETKILRIMDLIQIDMKGRYYEDFLLSDCYGGFDVSCSFLKKESILPFPLQRREELRACHVY